MYNIIVRIICVMAVILLELVVSAGDSHAQTETVFIRDTSRPECRFVEFTNDLTPSCFTRLTATRHFGACTYYSWGDDVKNLDTSSGTPRFQRITFPIGTVVTPAMHFATGGINDAGGNPIPIGTRITTNDVEVPPRTPYTGLTNMIVSCIKNVMLRLQDELATYTDYFYGITVLLATHAIMLLGIKLLYQGIKLPEALMRMLFIPLILYFGSYGALDYIQIFSQTQEDLTEVVWQTSSQSRGFCYESKQRYNDSSMVPDTSGQFRTYTIWESIDCIVASFLGLGFKIPGNDAPSSTCVGVLRIAATMPASHGQNGMLTVGGGGNAPQPGDRARFTDLAWQPYMDCTFGYISINYFLLATALLFTPLALVVVLLIAGILVMIATFLQAVVIYLISFTAIVVLGTISPIAIALALFGPTRKAFEFWFRALFAYTIQPAIIIGYLAFMTYVIANIFYGAPLTPAQQTQWRAGTMDQVTYENLVPARHSLMWWWKEWFSYGAEVFTTAPMIRVEGSTQTTNQAASISGAGRIGGAISMPQMDAFPGSPIATEKMLYSVALQIITAIVVLLVSYTMLVTVMNMGSRIAGLEASTRMININLFNASARGASRRM